MLICANSECAKEFEPKAHNQKYCTDDCCKVVTNKRLSVRYHARRAVRQGKTRWCERCQATRLSRYNDTLICSPCKKKSEVDANNSVLDMLINGSFA